MTDFKICPVSPRHLDDIEEIEALCFSMPWNRSALENQMLADNTIFLAAESDEGVLGYVGLLHVLDEGYISNVAVSPTFRRCGVADALIKALISRTEKTLAFLTLEVRESNLPAIALYEKHGFSAVGKRKNYYDRPKENAILMTLWFQKGDL
ncbi:MAG: ribosomal protein S18-alanine N-acetyltransferase [Oscillospiraceae bacterium]